MSARDKWNGYVWPGRDKKQVDETLALFRPEIIERDGKKYVKRGRYESLALGDEVYFWELLQDLEKMLTAQGLNEYLKTCEPRLDIRQVEALANFCATTLQKAVDAAQARELAHLQDIDEVRASIANKKESDDGSV